MDIKETIYNIEDLLPRYCEGQVSLEERTLVEKWADESEEHRKMIRQIYMINLSSDTLSTMEKVDVDHAFNKVNGRIRVRNIKVWLHYVEQVAAILFIPLLGMCFYLLNGKNHGSRMLTVRANPGMITQLTLPDGSQVSLNSESSLTYPEDFSGEAREVSLSGEAYFKVAKDPKHQFVVSAPHQTKIKVVGTSFNLEAFPGDSVISTTLQEGAVIFAYQGKEERMKPKEKLVYKVDDHSVRRINTTGEVEASWKDGKLIFKQTPFPEVLRMLEKRFNVEFIVHNKNIADNTFTGTFTNQRIDRILEVFKVSSKIKWKYVESQKTSDKKQKIEIYQ